MDRQQVMLFATVSSQYGNSSQVRTAVERGGIKQNANVMVSPNDLFGMQPFVGVAVAMAAAVAILKRRVDILVPIASLAPFWSSLHGATTPCRHSAGFGSTCPRSHW